MTHLTCGCCGNFFSGEPSPEHDTGYGTCDSCVADQEKQYQERIEQAKTELASCLSPENWIAFKNFSEEKQEQLILKFINKGVLKWSI